MTIAAVIGLGNPGAEYAATRHNVGFRVVDELAGRHAAGQWRRRYRSDVLAVGGQHALLLVKPRTFMNLSGLAVEAVCAGESITPEQCLVVVDDVELPLGVLRLRSRGGSGTHNGMRSVTAAVGGEFPRLRLGIRGEEQSEDLADYVLGQFLAGESAAVEAMVRRAADCVEAVLAHGLDRAAGAFNGPPAAPEP